MTGLNMETRLYVGGNDDRREGGAEGRYKSKSFSAEHSLFVAARV